MAANAFPTPIDYTSRDYESLKTDMLAYADKVLPEWTTRDENDFGMVLVEMFAGVADILNYYIDRVGNEAFMHTAVQRRSILALARLLGYNPSPLRAAGATLTLNNNSNAPIVIDPGTRFFSTGEKNGSPYNIYFETDTQVTVPIGSPGVATVTATQGVSHQDEILGNSDGSQNQEFILFNRGVADGSVQVWVNETGNYVPWRRVDHVIDFGPTDPVYESYEDDEGVVHVRFGDNVSGRVPTLGSIIKVDYRVCDGADGNVAANTITSSVQAIAGLSAITNQTAAVGGAERESNDSIRTNMPKALRAVNRAVTVNDFSSLAVQVSGITKANSVALTPNSIRVYVAPTSAQPTTAQQRSQVVTYLADKQLPNVSVTVTDATYVKVDISMTVQVLPQYRRDYVQQRVFTAMQDVLAFDIVDFAQKVSPGTITRAAMRVDGVDYVTITVLDRDGSTGTAGVTCTAGEIPIPDTITLTMAGGIS